MKDTPREDRLSRLSKLVDSRMALHFPRARWNDLERMTLCAAEELAPDDSDSFIERLISTPLTGRKMRILANHLTIGETYFWREPLVLEALENQILPELIRSREGKGKRLRIWSAGCSTGEECYSIAIALRRTLPAPDDWDIRILATDINTEALRKAGEGHYSDWSFRNAPPWFVGEYFHRGKDGKLAILPEIRRMVTFAYVNLAEAAYPSSTNGTNAQDIVFCRNVLMYFSAARSLPIVQNLHASLVEGGWLVVGASELSQSLFRPFACVSFPGAIVYRKKAEASLPAAKSISEAPIAVEPAVFRRAKPVPEPCAIEAVSPDDAPASPCDTASAARGLADQGWLSEALALCEKAIADAKLEPDLRYLEATILLELGREEEASAALEQTLYLDPCHVPAHFALGVLATRRGEAETGKRCLESALALLSARGDEDVVPESEGLTAGRFKEIIRATLRATLRPGASA